MDFTHITPGTPEFLLLCVAGYLGLANVLAYIAFGVDKSRAVNGMWRVPESTLLMLATMGGWIGAKLAQRRFRHKTRKQPFGVLLNLSGLVIPALVGTLLVTSGTVRTEALQAYATQASTKIQGMIGGGDTTTTTAKAELPHRFGPGSDAPKAD